MKLAQIVFPKHPHLYATHNWLEANIIANWNGYTAFPARGMWQDANGDGHFEEVIVYQVAMERADVIKLRHLAAEAAKLGAQQCVMIVTPQGDVEFVKNPVQENTHAG